MKKTVLVFLLFINLKGFCFAGEPTFAGIIWNDNNDTIIAKINKLQGFKDISPEKISISDPIWLCSSEMGISKAIDVQTKEVTKKRGDSDVDIETQILNAPDIKNPIRSIDFSRSKATDKLLIINIVFNNKVDTFARLCDSMGERLLKKYGLPSRIVRNTYQWIISGVELDLDYSNGTISYYHLSRIDEYCRLNRQKHESMTEAHNIDYGKLF